MTLERTFGFDEAKIQTFETNFNIILHGEVFALIEKYKRESDEQGNGKMHREKFETISDL
jgi:hypothetical protein